MYNSSDCKLELTLEMCQEYLGTPIRTVNNEVEWQCPICASNGGDTHKDNLKFNKIKNVLHCFADDEHSRVILSDMFKQEWEKVRAWNAANKNLTLDAIREELSETDKNNTYEANITYISLTQEMLKHDASGLLLENLMYHRGLTLDTALDVGLGYDDIEHHWVIPTVKYSTSINQEDYKVIGFEYRPMDFDKSGLRREKGGETALAMISPFTDKTEAIAIVEGYFDGYALYQHLKELNQLDYYHIVTCSNGVSSLVKQVAEINFTKYKKHYLFIDNDEAGRKAADEILTKYPFIVDITLTCGCKDFNEHYMKCIKKQNKNEN